MGARSVVFLGNSYYNFRYLAAALRARGWDALSVSLDDSDKQFTHGADLSLRGKPAIDQFFHGVPFRFGMVHFYGRGMVPAPALDWRRQGIKLGYSINGCADGAAQSSVRAWSGCCTVCPLQHVPTACSDEGNLSWGHRAALHCDLIATEGFPALDWQGGPNVFREPLTTALDPGVWPLDLYIPEHYRIAREPNEIVIYHGVGNYRAGRGGLKGTQAVVAAVKELQDEGWPVRLYFAQDVESSEVRFFQAQADIIVDQLNHGRYGATAREGMMLGKPVVCRLIRAEPPGAQMLQSIAEAPLVSASEKDIAVVLRGLVIDPERRGWLGRVGRDFAFKWHSAQRCAERYERVYDALMRGDSVASVAAL